MAPTPKYPAPRAPKLPPGKTGPHDPEVGGRPGVTGKAPGKNTPRGKMPGGTVPRFPTTGTPSISMEQRGGDAVGYMKAVQAEMKAPFSPSGGGAAGSGAGTTGPGGGRGGVGGGVLSRRKPKARGGHASTVYPKPPVTG